MNIFLAVNQITTQRILSSGLQWPLKRMRRLEMLEVFEMLDMLEILAMLIVDEVFNQCQPAAMYEVQPVEGR